MPNILLIDDDTDLLEYVRDELNGLGHVVECLDCPQQGLDRLTESGFDVVVLDNSMPRITGLDFLEKLPARGITVPVILMTGIPSTYINIRATVLGAVRYVIKPDDYRGLVDKLHSEITRFLDNLWESDRALKSPRRNSPDLPDGAVLVGDSAPMQEVCHRIGLFAPHRPTVLIRGETGTGKELVARAIHDASPRGGKPFHAVNSAAISSGVAGSELFGHVKGAFTGADRDKQGWFEVADGGTLFFDEIGDMAPDQQRYLLRVLQNPVITRVGCTKAIKVDVRVLAATHQNLPRMVEEGRFREDLYYRLDRFVIRVPPLRERAEDIPALVDRFLRREAKETGRSAPPVTDATMGLIRSHTWPGNVRELENVITRAYANSQGRTILPSHVELGRGDTPAATAEDEAMAGLRKAIEWAWNGKEQKPLPLLQELVEKELIRVALQRLGDNRESAADRIGMSKTTLYKRMTQYGLE